MKRILLTHHPQQKEIIATTIDTNEIQKASGKSSFGKYYLSHPLKTRLELSTYYRLAKPEDAHLIHDINNKIHDLYNLKKLILKKAFQEAEPITESIMKEV